MRKRQIIDQNKVAANAFLTTKEDALDVDQVKRYVELVSEKINGKTNMFVGGLDIHEFLARYSFAFCVNQKYKYIYLLSEIKNGKILEGLFREGLPEEIIPILKETGRELSLEQIEDKTTNEYVKTK